MTVFDSFQEIQYEFLEIKRGAVKGNVITKSSSFYGIFKLRQNQEEQGNIELYQSSATLHAHPDDYSDFDNLVGQGIEVNGTTYEITNVTGGMNFDNGQMEHLTFTLQRAEFIDGRTTNDND